MPRRGFVLNSKRENARGGGAKKKSKVPDSEPSDELRAALAKAVCALRVARSRQREADAECDRRSELRFEADEALKHIVEMVEEQHGRAASVRALAEAKLQDKDKQAEQSEE